MAATVSTRPRRYLLIHGIYGRHRRFLRMDDDRPVARGTDRAVTDSRHRHVVGDDRPGHMDTCPVSRRTPWASRSQWGLIAGGARERPPLCLARTRTHAKGQRPRVPHPLDAVIVVGPGRGGAALANAHLFVLARTRTHARGAPRRTHPLFDAVIVVGPGRGEAPAHSRAPVTASPQPS